jgi:hypothetical protein
MIREDSKEMNRSLDVVDGAEVVVNVAVPLFVRWIK